MKAVFLLFTFAMSIYAVSADFLPDEIPAENTDKLDETWKPNNGFDYQLRSRREADEDLRNKFSAYLEKHTTGNNRDPTYHVDYERTLFKDDNMKISAKAGYVKSPYSRGEGRADVVYELRFRREVDNDDLKL